MRRLASLTVARHRIDRWRLRLVRLRSRREPTDLLRLYHYRSDHFGAPFTRWADAVLRGPSQWSVGERELLAAFTAELNQCRAVADAHAAVAAIARADDLTKAVLVDWRSAPADERLRAALSLLEVLTLRPEEVGPADVESLRRAGVSPDGVVDVINICGLACTISRVSDALGLATPGPTELARLAPAILDRGYRLG